MKLKYSGNFDTGEFECYVQNELSGKKRILMVQRFDEMNQHSNKFSKEFFFYMQKCLEAIYQSGVDDAIDIIDWDLQITKQKLRN